MPWTDRQRAMLQEMGLRVWSPQPADEAAGPDSELSAVRDERAPEPDARARQPDAAHTEAPIAPTRRVVSEPPSERRTALPVDAARAPAREMTGSAAEASASPSIGDLGHLGWDDLRGRVQSCSACGLCEGRRNTVFGVGNTEAHWMVIGEAPGEQEDAQGEPFVGKSGQLLDNMLRALGLTRQDAEPQRQVYIANTVKCRPPGNRNPQPEELARCEPYLVRQIALVQPRIILAMGRFAVQSLLRTQEPIGRLRGRVHTYQGVPLVVTYHPAYLLRNPEDKARAWDDLCLAMATLRGGTTTG